MRAAARKLSWARRLGLCVLVVVLMATGCGSDDGTDANGEASVPDAGSAASEATEPGPADSGGSGGRRRFGAAGGGVGVGGVAW